MRSAAPHPLNTRALTRAHAPTHAPARAHGSRPLAPARPEAQSRPTLPPYHQWGWQGGGGSLGGGRGHGGREAGGEPSAEPPAAPPAPPPGLAPPSPSDSFRTDSVPNTSQGTPALPRPPHPSTESPVVLYKGYYTLLHRFIVQGTEGEEEPGREEGGGEGEGKDGGREGERLSASRRCRWRKGVTSG